MYKIRKLYTVQKPCFPTLFLRFCCDKVMFLFFPGNLGMLQIWKAYRVVRVAKIPVGGIYHFQGVRKVDERCCLPL